MLDGISAAAAHADDFDDCVKHFGLIINNLQRHHISLFTKPTGAFRRRIELFGIDRIKTNGEQTIAVCRFCPDRAEVFAILHKKTRDPESEKRLESAPFAPFKKEGPGAN